MLLPPSTWTSLGPIWIQRSASQPRTVTKCPRERSQERSGFSLSHIIHVLTNSLVLTGRGLNTDDHLSILTVQFFCFLITKLKYQSIFVFVILTL